MSKRPVLGFLQYLVPAFVQSILLLQLPPFPLSHSLPPLAPTFHNLSFVLILL